MADFSSKNILLIIGGLILLAVLVNNYMTIGSVSSDCEQVFFTSVMPGINCGWVYDYNDAGCIVGRHEVCQVPEPTTTTTTIVCITAPCNGDPISVPTDAPILPDLPFYKDVFNRLFGRWFTWK